MAQQSLYRRYRPRRFSELRGQDHVSTALVHAVASGTEGHAYLFSGPRGTGKTSTARILAKALNCTALEGGEPCGGCDSCVAMDAGTSYDLFELDAASNNGVDAVRELISRTAVGSPGRTKVYILDEVHMLSTAASNALLKTLEEPPDHVVFVLATTDPQKVLPTIRSRTQHFEFSLLTAEELTDHVRWVIEDAGLDLDPAVVPDVVRMGKGSARDTLSALDRVVALGGVDRFVVRSDELLRALADRHTGDAMAAIATSIATGMEPRTIGEALLGQLRDAFLVAVKAETPHLTVDDRAAAVEVAATMGTPRVTRALELLGTALVDMRQATDQRIPLEVAVVRLCNAEADTSPAALVERLTRLEQAVGGGAPLPPVGPSTAPAGPSTAPAGPSVTESDDAETGPETAPRGGGRRGAADARARLSARRAATEPGPAAPPDTPPARTPAPPVPSAPTVPPTSTVPPATPSPSAPPPAAPPAAASAPPPPTDPAPAPDPVSAPAGAITLQGAQAVLDEVLGTVLKGATRAIYNTGRLVEVEGSTFVIAMANSPTLTRAEQSRVDVEAALGARAGQPVTVRLVDDSTSGRHPGGGPAPSGGAAGASEAVGRNAAPDDHEDEEAIDISELADAPAPSRTGVERITEAFPGAVVIDEEQR